MIVATSLLQQFSFFIPSGLNVEVLVCLQGIGEYRPLPNYVERRYCVFVRVVRVISLVTLAPARIWMEYLDGIPGRRVCRAWSSSMEVNSSIRRSKR